MPDITNRSAYYVTVARHPEHNNKFPYSPTGRCALKAYVNQLRTKGLKPQVAQGTDCWQVRVRRTGYPVQIKTFSSLTEADAFVKSLDAEQTRGLFRDYTAAANTPFSNLVQRYIDEECPRLKGGANYALILRAMLEDSTGSLAQRIRAREAEMQAGGQPLTKRNGNRVPMANLEWMQRPMTEIQATDIEDFIKERLQFVAPATVDRQLDLLRAVIKVATKTWGYYVERSPFEGVRSLTYYNERDRRLAEGEETQLLAAVRQEDHFRSFELAVKNAALDAVAHSRRLGTHYARNAASKEGYEVARATVLETGFPHLPLLEAFVLFQLGTAARRGETLGLRWTDIDTKAQTAKLATTKNGRARKLAVPRKVLDVLERLPRTSEFVFDISVKELSTAWKKVCMAAGIDDLHIHDLRHEAISRLAESGLFPSVLDLQAFSGHRDLRSLARYTHLSASALAKTIDAGESAIQHRGRLRLKSSDIINLDLNPAALAAPAAFDDAETESVPLAPEHIASNVVPFPQRHITAMR